MEKLGKQKRNLGPGWSHPILTDLTGDSAFIKLRIMGRRLRPTSERRAGRSLTSRHWFNERVVLNSGKDTGYASCIIATVSTNTLTIFRVMGFDLGVWMSFRVFLLRPPH